MKIAAEGKCTVANTAQLPAQSDFAQCSAVKESIRTDTRYVVRNGNAGQFAAPLEGIISNARARSGHTDLRQGRAIFESTGRYGCHAR